MAQNNIKGSKPDGIATGKWSFDEHMTGKFAVPVGGGKYEVQLEGNFWPACGPYDVPYSALTPKRGTGSNLLVPVCLSASAVAYSSTRIETMFMAVGTAAGVAAKQLVDGEVTVVQDVNVSKVQEILVNQFHQAVHCDQPAPPGPPYTGPKSFTVVGAGSTSWNGEYQMNPGAGQLSFVHTANASQSMYANGGVWRLAIEGKELMYLAGKKTSRPAGGPPAQGWEIPKPGGKGKAPIGAKIMKFVLKNEECCINNEEFCIKMVNFAGGVAPPPHLVPGPADGFGL